MALSIYSIYGLVFRFWRKKRFKLFLRLLKPSGSDVLLDVGGYPWYWTTQPQPVKQIDVLNVHEVSWQSRRFPNHNIRTLLGDGCSLNFSDKSYDIGYSNSVIEHVGSWQRQQEFASELRRVAKALWVQTPAYECPIEPHYMAPFIHYFPKAIRRRLVRWCTLRGWIERPTRGQIDSMVNTTRLLRRSEMLQLFPDCELVTERMFWLIPKSYIAFRLASKDK